MLKEIYAGGLFEKLGESLSVIDVDQFYGIEIGEFPARIAETALWMMDHIMNNRLSLTFGQAYARIPLQTSPHILHGDALEMDWADLLPPAECSFVFGNPPFSGAKWQGAEQRAQVRRIAALGKTGGTLDYVCAWFIRAGEYVKTSQARIGFVSTNSITPGRAGGTAMAGTIRSLQAGDRLCPPHLCPGVLTLAERHMCTWSFSAWTGGRPRGPRDACSVIPT